jgi:hypothetical protein
MTAFLIGAGRSIIRKDRISPRVTGGEKGLYGFTNVDPEFANSPERDFFTPVVDGPGHIALAKIKEDGLDSLSQDERVDWAVYLVAATMRTPDAVERARAMGPEILAVELDWKPEEYTRLRTDHDPPTLGEWLRVNAPAYQENFGIISLTGAILDENTILPILQMHWHVADMSDVPFKLLTSDRPLWVSAHPSDDRCWIVFPISPTKLFMAARPNMKIRRWESLDQLADLSNRSQCMGASKWVYGEASDEFVREHVRNNSSTALRT